MIIFTSAVVGTLIGVIASVVLKQNSPLRFLTNIILGVIGSIIAGVFSLSTKDAAIVTKSDVDFHGIGYSIIGAFLLLTIKELYRRNAGRY